MRAHNKGIHNEAILDVWQVLPWPLSPFKGWVWFLAHPKLILLMIYLFVYLSFSIWNPWYPMNSYTMPRFHPRVSYDLPNFHKNRRSGVVGPRGAVGHLLSKEMIWEYSCFHIPKMVISEAMEVPQNLFFFLKIVLMTWMIWGSPILGHLRSLGVSQVIKVAPNHPNDGWPKYNIHTHGDLRVSLLGDPIWNGMMILE